MLRSSLLCVLICAAYLLVLVSDADAQRRRRRRRPPPEEQQQTEPVEEEQAQEQPEGEGDSDLNPMRSEVEQPSQEELDAAAEQAAQQQAAQQQAEEPPPEDEFAGGPDLGPIQADFAAIMDELVQVRSRVAVLGQQLFQTKVRVQVQNRATDDNTLQRIVLKLDGAPIFRAEGGEFSGEEGRQVFEGFAAPGPHVLEIEYEQRSRADDEYRYTNRDQFRFQVVRGVLTEIEIVLDDDSDIGEDFEDDGEGEYDVQTRFRVATREIDAR